MGFCRLARGVSYNPTMTSHRRAMRETLLYGLFAGVLIVLLRLVEFRYLILQESEPVYVGIIAALFAFLGIRLGQKIVGVKTIERVVVETVHVPGGAPFERNQA